MCGIAGYSGAGDRDTLAQMIGAIAWRGPDARTHWVEERAGAPAVGLAHGRLSVLDLEGGAQPMWTADGEVGVVFNGEIYNFAALRRELEALGCVFHTDHSDTEVLLHAWRTWGDGFVSRLNGMWAFALLDRRQRVLLLSRDRFGKKPLYWRAHAQGVVFASEARALRRHPAGRTAPDPLSLRQYLCHGYVPEPASLWTGVHKLPGGCNLRVPLEGGAPQLQRWWQFELAPPGPGDAAPAVDATPDALRRVLEGAVARRLVADVPVGTFLSGGLDSSTVSALAARLHGGRLMTFSIGFDEDSFDESAHARAVARHIGSAHVEERLGVDSALALVDEVLSRMAEPSADSSILPTWLVSRLARRHVTVALGGDGADELLAGYAPFQALRAAALAERLPGPLLALARGVAGALPVSHGYMSLDFRLKRTLGGLGQGPAMWLPLWMAPMTLTQAEALLGDGQRADPAQVFGPGIAAWQRGVAAAAGLDTGQQHIAGLLQTFTDTYLRDGILAKVDQASMLNSLEVRTPFLDIEVADYARRLPLSTKYAGGQGKRLLREAARGLIPDAVIDRPKQGFAVPIGRWFREGRLALDTTRLNAPLRPDAVRALQQAHRDGRRDERLALWALLALDHALRDGAPA